MPVLISIVLALALLWALYHLLRLRAAARHLRQAIRLRRPLLRDDIPGSIGGFWDDLAQETNELIAEATHLQHQRRSQLAQLEATLGSLQEAVLIVDSDNTILLANKALHAIFPTSLNSLHQRLERVLHSVAFLEYVQHVKAGTATPRREMEFAEGNRTVWMEVTGTSIPPLDGTEHPWALFVLHDITQQKKLEGVRKEFVANVSHELRTPLSIIKGYIETLVDGHEEIPAGDRDRFLRTIQRHTERLNSLLEDLLILSRLESINPGLRRETTALPALLEGILEDYRARPAAEGHSLELTCDPGLPDLFIDPLKITQVLENLLDNALKYTPRGSRIDVSAKATESAVELRVVDNGPGIPAADLPHIFERFYRVDKGRSREKGGTGLGLSIVKHIVQLHGGKVSAQSILGQGTTFILTLPLRQPTPIERAAD